MAISTYKVFLMKRGTGSGAATWAKFLDIKDFPDLGGAPELLDTTTLSDRVKTGILGIQDNALMAFTCNYDKDDYAKVKAEKGKDNEWAVWFGGTEQTMSLAHIINDVFMAIFFLLVGLEVKYEMTVGELTNIRAALLLWGAGM